MISETMQAWLDTAPQWILNGPEWFENFGYEIFKAFIFDQRYMLYLTGLGNTLRLTFFALILGIIIGVVVALVRVSWDKKSSELQPGIGKSLLWVSNFIAKIYLTVIRGTPVIVQIFIIFFIIMASSNDKFLAGVVAFGINSGAYTAEIMRGGIMSIDNGQTEAGRSLGFGYVQTMLFIVLPQAVKTVLPTLVNEFITLIKETAVIGYVGLMDLTYAGNIIIGATYSAVYPLLGVAATYLILVIFLTWIMGKIERRLRRNEK